MELFYMWAWIVIGLIVVLLLFTMSSGGLIVVAGLSAAIVFMNFVEWLIDTGKVKKSVEGKVVIAFFIILLLAYIWAAITGGSTTGPMYRHY